MNLPSRASDAGPMPRVPHVDDVKCVACNCHVSKWSAWRCEGAAGGVDSKGVIIPADMCCSMQCDDCLVKCFACNLPVCADHRNKIDGETLCQTCQVSQAAASVLEVSLAMEEGRI